MAKPDDLDRLPLPKSWPTLAKRALVLVNSMLKISFDIELGHRLDCASRHAREHAEHERFRLDRDSDREVLGLISTRFGRLDPKKRPLYTKAERLRILGLKALNGWTAVQTAERFLLDEKTVCRWMRELAEVGEERLLAIQPPVNKFPDFVDRIVARMVVALPQPTKRNIATRLARAGLHISASAVYDRMKTPPGPDFDAAAAEDALVSEEPESPRTVAAHYPDHVWNVDLTTVPIRGGFWSPLVPFALPQIWPFCWWIAATVDMFSRKAMGFAAFKRPPTSRQVQEFLRRAFNAVGVKPKYLVTDRGKQFDCHAFRKWCKQRKVKPRYGAVGKYGSIAVIERFNRTLKYEGLFLISIPFSLHRMREEVRLIIEHYNRFRPHQGLTGRTPDEVYFDGEPAIEKPRWEPRPKWPREGGCAAPYVPVRGECGARLELKVSHLEGRKHLSIFRLREAA
ncbi:MAG: transposase [Planctomycetota bacterium]